MLVIVWYLINREEADGNNFVKSENDSFFKR